VSGGAKAARKATLLLVGLCLGIGLLGSGCGVRPSGVIHGVAAPTGPVYGVYLYFADSTGRLTAVLRPTNPPPSPSATLAMLVGGPDADEQAQGFRTELPPDVARSSWPLAGPGSRSRWPSTRKHCPQWP
jgi:hypothetical protein